MIETREKHITDLARNGRRRTRRLRWLPSIVMACGVLALTAWAQDFDSYQVETTPLADHLFLMTGAGGNMAVCTGEDGVLLVDSDYLEMSEKVAAAVAALSDLPVRFVVNTHWHFDHVGGNEKFGRGGSSIVAHTNVRKHMATDQFIAVIDHEVQASPPEALPAVTFTDTHSFDLGVEEISVIHLPHAHTDGDGVVHFHQANVIHAGDIFFNCGYPFIDINHGGTIDGLIVAVEAILRMCDEETRIIPGHGPLASRKDLQTYRAMLRDFREAVAKEAATGKDLEAILETNATADLDRKWGKIFFPPAAFTEMVLRTLPRE